MLVYKQLNEIKSGCRFHALFLCQLAEKLKSIHIAYSAKYFYNDLSEH